MEDEKLCTYKDHAQANMIVPEKYKKIEEEKDEWSHAELTVKLCKENNCQKKNSVKKRISDERHVPQTN